MGNRMVTWP